MDPVNVFWLSYHKDVLARGYWDQGLLEDTFNKGNFNHHIGMKDLEGGGVVVINGRTHVEDIEKINQDISKLDWVLFIITGDEEALFPWADIKHPMKRIWVMLPRMNEHNDISYRLVNGYRPDTREILKVIGPQQRRLDWSFIGQNNHERRELCAVVLRQLEPMYPNKCKLVETDAFGKEVVNYNEYLKTLASTKIAPCPSGIESPDSFRLYEALEAGCYPVVDAFSTNNQAPGFWKYLFGESPPFPIVDYWDKFFIILPDLLNEWPNNANKVFAWWQGIKRSMYWKLIDDIRELSK